MPGDERFVGAIRLLAAQAASYAKLSEEAGEALAGVVERTTQALLQSVGRMICPSTTHPRATPTAFPSSSRTAPGAAPRRPPPSMGSR